MTTASDTAALAEVDLTDLDRWWADGPPHALFARMRAEAPVHRNASADGHGFWSLTRGSEIREVSTNPGTFSCARGGIFLRPDALGPLEFMRNLAIAKDPPEHTRFREIVSKVFRARTLVLIDEHIKHSVANALERIAERGSCDLVKDIAEPIPLRVIGRMIGAPDEDMGQLLAWTEEIEIGIAHSQDVSATFAKMATHLLGTVDNQVIRGVDSLASSLAEAEVDGQRLTADEIALYFGLLLYAGNGPTRNAISAGMLALMEHPDQLQGLRANPILLRCTRSGLPTAALSEIFRWSSSVNYLARTATRDTALAGVDIKADDRVVMWYASANRDSEVLPRADVFDITRPVREITHFAFGGGGPHFCQAEFLATKMLSVALPEIIRRMPGIAPAGGVTRARTAFANQLVSFPVTFSPAA
jgi:cytochrome P450